MENKGLPKDNLLCTLRERRLQNARQQIKTVLLESYELFGKDFTEEVVSDCKDIYNDYVEHYPDNFKPVDL